MSLLGSLAPRRTRNLAGGKTAGPRVALSGRFGAAVFGGMGQSDPTAQMEQYGRSATLFSVVNLAASSFSGVEWRLFRVSDGRGRISGPDPRREVTSHAALDMWNAPNSWMPGQLFREVYQQHLKLTGQAFWVISYVGSIPAQMWPVRPDRMEPVPDEKLFISGWVYTGPNGERVPLKTTEVVWLRQPHPLNPYSGMSAVEPLMPDVDSARATSDWNRNFFRNSALPGGFLELPEGTRLGDDQWEEMTTRWDEQHRGVNRAHRVAILEMGAKFTPNTYTMADMQFVELRQDSRNIIYEGFGTSKSLLGVVDDVNRASMEGTEYGFSKYRLKPDLDRSKGALNYSFLPLFGSAGSGVTWDYDNPIPKDWQADAATTNANASAAAKLVSVGYDPQDVANAMSLPNIKHTGVIPGVVKPPQDNPDETYESAETEKDAA